MIFKHVDIIRLAINNGRQLHIVRGYHNAVRRSVTPKGNFRDENVNTLLHELLKPGKRFDSIFYSLQCFSTTQTTTGSKDNQKNKDTEKSSKQSDSKKPDDGEVAATVPANLEKSPLEVTMKAGKLIVSAVEDLKKETPKSLEKLAPNQLKIQSPAQPQLQEPLTSKSYELPMKNATLLVHATTTINNQLDSIVLEQINKKNESKAGAKDSTTTALSPAAAAAAAVAQKQSQRRERVDFSRSSMERNFITPARAISDFLLKMSDLESLPKTKRRSPYEQEPPIVVFWRKDVEAKAIEVWGSRENLLRECLKRELERKQHQQNIFTVKRRLRDYRREMGQRSTVTIEPGLRSRSGRVVITAIVINAVNFVFKLCAWLYTGSHSMFAECIHSFADTTNQIILAYGIHKSTQTADPDHPYGYTNMKYVSSLISGVGIFCVGTGLSFYHGIMGLMTPVPCEDFFWAFCILGGSLLSEGATLMVAVNSIRQSAKQANVSFREYVIRGEDPSVNVVLFEDAAAVASVVLAAGCMGLSTYMNSSTPDAIGSLLVGCMLGGVASFIISTNVQALVGRSIPAEQLDRINSELEKDVMIRAIHDVKGIDMGSSLVRYKAELDFDGRELTRFYLDKQDLNQLLQEVKTFTTVDELEAFILKHGENIVDLMGGEIDRIEIKLRKKFPEIRHCDLEIL